MAKLSNAQVKALLVLGRGQVRITSGQPFCSMPEGIRSTAVLHTLDRRGYVTVTHDGNANIWKITSEGFAALSAAVGVTP